MLIFGEQSGFGGVPLEYIVSLCVGLQIIKKTQPCQVLSATHLGSPNEARRGQSVGPSREEALLCRDLSSCILPCPMGR